MDSVKQYIARYVRLDPLEFEFLTENLIEKKFGKKEYLLKSGKICKKRYFILKGLVRTFYIDSQGNERITQFAKEDWWVTDMESYVNETPSNVSIQAIEDTSLLEISKENLERVFQKSSQIERLFRIITEKWLVAQQRSSHFYMKASGKERYENLVDSIPNFVQRVPQYMIASYLDISPEHLSTLRKQARDGLS